MLGQIFTKSQNKIQDPAKLYSLINMIERTGWVIMGADVKGENLDGCWRCYSRDELLERDKASLDVFGCRIRAYPISTTCQSQTS